MGYQTTGYDPERFSLIYSLMGEIHLVCNALVTANQMQCLQILLPNFTRETENIALALSKAKKGHLLARKLHACFVL